MLNRKVRGAALGDGVRLSAEQRLDWLRLIRSDNVGPRTFRDLVNTFAARTSRSPRCPASPVAAAHRVRRVSARTRTPKPK
jgi:DNA processing protein